MEKEHNCDYVVWEEEKKNCSDFYKQCDAERSNSIKKIAKSKTELEKDQAEDHCKFIEVNKLNSDIKRTNKKISNIDELDNEPYFLHLYLKSDSDSDDYDAFITENATAPVCLENNKWLINFLSGGGIIDKIRDNYYIRGIEFQPHITFNGNAFDYDYQRAIDIKERELISVDEVYDAGSHDQDIKSIFLKRVLKENQNVDGMISIVKSIQEQQYRIISAPYNNDFTVQGCAGSGKTAIMIHRLLFMKMQEVKINWDKVCIITPSVFFQDYSADMMNHFKLGLICQMTIEDYYLKLLEIYDKKDFGEKSKLKSVTIDSLPDDYVNAAYCNENIYNMKSIADQYLSELLLRLREYGLNVINDGSDIDHTIETAISKVDSFIEIWDKYNDLIKADKDLTKWKKEQKTNKKEVDKLNGKIKSNAKKIAGLWMEIAEEASGEDKNKKTTAKIDKYTKIDVQIKYDLAEANKAVSAMDKKIENRCNKYAEGSKYIIATTDTKTIKQIRKELNNIEISAINAAISTVTNPVRKEYGLEEFNTGANTGWTHFELAIATYVFSLYNDDDNLKRFEFMCIDEGQNLSLFEYELLREIEAKAVFNIYGDIRQRIYSDVGVDNWKSINDIGNVYTLNQNYRNTKPIVEYCNDEFGLDMIGLGLDGDPVDEFAIEELNSEERIDCVSYVIDQNRMLDDKMVIIVEDVDSYINFKEYYDGTATLSRAVDGHLTQKTNVIDVLTVAESIGMEFSSVIVFSEGMSATEKYISCTRALKKLIVISKY